MNLKTVEYVIVEKFFRQKSDSNYYVTTYFSTFCTTDIFPSSYCRLEILEILVFCMRLLKFYPMICQFEFYEKPHANSEKKFLSHDSHDLLISFLFQVHVDISMKTRVDLGAPTYYNLKRECKLDANMSSDYLGTWNYEPPKDMSAQG